MTALWIANVDVTDPVRYAEYAKRATVAIAAHGGVFLARGGEHRQLEGRDRARNVVVRFPDMAAALACYGSDGYREALTYAEGAAERDLVVVEEVA